MFLFQASSSLPSGVKIGPTDGIVVIDKAEAAHTGRYTCTAKNIIRQVSKTANLFVQGQLLSCLITIDGVIVEGAIMYIHQVSKMVISLFLFSHRHAVKINTENNPINARGEELV